MVIGLTYAEFKQIPWPNTFPYVICDLIETISGFSMNQELQDRISRKEEEDRLTFVTNAIKNERDKSPGLKQNDKQLRERFEKESLSDKERKLTE